MHDHSRRLAWTLDGSLKIWQDDVGLAFQFNLPSNRTGLGLIEGIRRGTFRFRASFHSPGDGFGDVDVVTEAGRLIHVINRINVDEISIAPAGANPAAVVWLDCEPVDEMPPYVADARRQWLAGRPQSPAKPRARATPSRVTAHGRSSARPPAEVLRRIDRALADERLAPVMIFQTPPGRPFLTAPPVRGRFQKRCGCSDCKTQRFGTTGGAAMCLCAGEVAESGTSLGPQRKPRRCASSPSPRMAPRRSIICRWRPPSSWLKDCASAASGSSGTSRSRRSASVGQRAGMPR